MMRKLFILIALCFLSFLSYSQKKVYSLHECIEIAQKNNLDIREKRLTHEQKGVAYQQARANLLPNLNASVGQNFIFGRSIGIDNTYQNTNSLQTSFALSSSFTIFDGLKMKHDIEARKAYLAASDADLDKIKEDIAINVSTAFLLVLMNKELVQIATDQIELSKYNICRKKELVNSGKSLHGEVLELESQLAKENFNLVNAENKLKLSKLDLMQIMELEDLEDFDISIETLDSLFEEGLIFLNNSVYENAFNNRPEIRSIKFQIDAAKNELLAAKSQYFPSISLGAQMNTGYYKMNGRDNISFNSQIQNNLSNSIGVTLNIPIFNRFQVRNAVKNMNIILEKTKLNESKAKIELRKHIDQAFYNALAAQSRLEAAQKSETANREALRFVQEKYENGRATSYELFQAKNILIQVLGEKTQAKYEYAFRLKILKFLVK